MAIRKTIWVSGQSLPTIVNDFESPAQSSSYQVISSDYIEATFNMTSSANSYRYDDMSSISDYTVQSGDYLEYDVYWQTAGAILIGMDLTCTDTSELRDSGVVDQNGLSPHPNVDISSRTSGLWYHRKIPLTTLVGKTISRYDLVCENDSTGTYVARFKNMLITDGNETTTTSTSSSTSSTSTSISTSQSTSTSLSTSSTSRSTSTSSTSISTSTTTAFTNDIPVNANITSGRFLPRVNIRKNR